MSFFSSRRRANQDPEEDRVARRTALAEPGPSWRQWFYDSFLKVWILFLFFVTDVWIVVGWLSPWNAANVLYAALSFLAAVYLENLAYQFFWYEPPELTRSSHEEPPPRWLHPVLRGRWTPGWSAAKAMAARSADDTPDPREFL
ncbi:MAG: hypothetical protein WA691_01285 [Thermoplasmata archaeon]